MIRLVLEAKTGKQEVPPPKITLNVPSRAETKTVEGEVEIENPFKQFILYTTIGVGIVDYRGEETPQVEICIDGKCATIVGKKTVSDLVEAEVHDEKILKLTLTYAHSGTYTHSLAIKYYYYTLDELFQLIKS